MTIALPGPRTTKDSRPRALILRGPDTVGVEDLLIHKQAEPDSTRESAEADDVTAG
ncbi:hypothetical protein GGTG_09118 [Gaeumannomyces tritici R3-111a-1]|uniref:Uncharacterized protein n=1 Tax=Gaeumannomyces tritici (strain R3-111a-1) TaxID=644352 RepID=J3P6H7_GAET3|nr:hypothetical protein GGTG_09118 [Gaeumannomyces tritici R3-111a-1]EJT72252.1 hypothetical protein GGTG_09118 [Gaeumannomyces tritici R3-111a-1]